MDVEAERRGWCAARFTPRVHFPALPTPFSSQQEPSHAWLLPTNLSDVSAVVKSVSTANTISQRELRIGS
jgi:hypothetical protein